MKLVKFESAGQTGVGVLEEGQIVPLALTPECDSLAAILNSPNARATVESLQRREPVALSEAQLLAPIDEQEVWAAGVTYLRSQTARMEESETAADCYDRVYQSERPELFMKATPHRVSGPGSPVRIRVDSNWNVPEPEVALAVSSDLQLVGFTVGNDMSSRDIEGDNPLYLPQAKVYNQCCGLGPCVALADSVPEPAEMTIHLVIHRDGAVVFDEQTDAGQMARSFTELIGWLGRDNSFPNGAFLLTGTGIVPDDFTLQPGDVVDIDIAGVGRLSNPVVQG
ncbi:MAG: fumarylacetoacetate hydrolase family protein [Planctomycetales bacterium]|nr:fumarylacetoacetate hydrolase family protein [Planctomycetales bacterium]